jgi:hypothetical protein
MAKIVEGLKGLRVEQILGRVQRFGCRLSLPFSLWEKVVRSTG